jgi:class 3 adenylate cyclase
MGLTADMKQEVEQIIKTQWVERDGTKVPEPEDVKLGNDAVKLDGVVLYADIADSTQMVRDFKQWWCAEIYKCYLLCACRIIRYMGGVITAFDGDRVMAVFVGDNKESLAARTALGIHHAVQEVVVPRVKKEWESAESVQKWQLRHAVGLDVCNLFIARTGIRGSNDLVWVGTAANYAAKLCALREGNYASYMTAEVYDKCLRTVLESKTGTPMWESFTWGTTGKTAYRSTWYWEVEA